MSSWVTFHSLTSLEDFLMWELDTLQYDAITVCFHSRDTTQPNSLISLNPNSICSEYFFRTKSPYSEWISFAVKGQDVFYTLVVYSLAQGNARVNSRVMTQ